MLNFNLKKTLIQENFGPLKYWDQKNVGLNKFLVQNWVKKIC